MIDLPQDPKRRLKILYALNLFGHDKRLKPIVEWLEEIFVEMANTAMRMDGTPLLYRMQGCQITIDDLLKYVKNSSDEIDSLEEALRKSR
jgi:hypothetical protein